jgi:hypothetical protein
MSNVKKPYCKVCFDARKSESEYTSHWVRSLPDRNGKTTVTCPTLLNTECRYCYQTGHTTKFCKQLEKPKRVQQVKQVQKQQQVQKKPASVFTALIDSDSEEEEPEPAHKEKEPTRSECWASIVAKPAEAKKVEVVVTTKPGLILLSDYIKIPEPKCEPKAAPWIKKPIQVRKSWADESDEDDEDDEESYYAVVTPPAFVSDDDDTW